MKRRDFLKAAASLGGLAMTARAQAAAPKANLGLLLYSARLHQQMEKPAGLSHPLKFLEFASQYGANAIQMPVVLPSDVAGIRRMSEQLNIAIEGIVAPPDDRPPFLEQFAETLKTARACGVTVVRIAMLSGRRYETFQSAKQYAEFAKYAEKSLQQIVKIAEREKIVLAVENHKDFRTDELIDLLKRLSSEWVGVCLDTGNNLALLEDPQAVVEALAPWTRTVHLKDIGVEEYPQGFRMAEVPLGYGTLDLKRIVDTVWKVNPTARFQLEMITRDPLSIPCLTEGYWDVMGKLPARDLAQTLSRVRSTTKGPLQRVTALPRDQQVALEDENIRRSFEHAAKVGLIP